MKRTYISWSVSLVVVMSAIAILFIGATAVHAQQVAGPTVPQGISASVNQSNQVYVSWNPSTETSTAVVGYYLYRNGSLIANTPGFTFYTDSPSAGAYAYSVAAYDAQGTISLRSVSTPTVSVIADNTPPSTPAGGLVASISSSSVALSWGASTDNFAVIGYYVYRNGVKLLTSSPISGTSYLDSGLSEGNTYVYSVVAYDAAGNLSAPTDPVTVKTIFDVQAPTAPQGIIAKAVSSNEIDVSWQPATDNIIVSGYRLYRDGNLITTIASTSYNDTGLTAGTNYGYSVYAYDEVGNTSMQGPSANAATFAPDYTPPSTPGAFSAVALSGSQVSLSWSPSTDNIGVSQYTLYRDGTQIATCTSTSYVDTNLATSTTYEYVIKASDAAGNVSTQASLAIKTLATPAVVVAPVSTTPPVTTQSSSPITSTTPVTPVITTPTQSSAPSVAANNFSTALYYGLRSLDVQSLQVFLIGQGDLGVGLNTGFYGNLTTAAVQKFQCAQNIVCSGSPYLTGWGSVGPRTRAALNAF